MAQQNLKKAALAVALSFAAAAAFAQSSTGKSAMANDKSASLAKADRKFVEETAQDGMLEVQLGNFVASHSSNDQVKQFGQRMATDHGKANDALRTLASSKGVDLPTALDKKHEKELAKYEREKPSEFDREYMEHMVKDHKKDVKEFDKQSKNAKDPDVKSFAEKTLPTLQEHLTLAQSTYDAVKGKRKTASK